MHVTVAIVAAIAACCGVYLNDLLSRRRRLLTREGLLGQSFDYDETSSDTAMDPRLARYGRLRFLANGLGLLFCGASALLLYNALFSPSAVDASFWAAWAGATGTSALFFWTGR